MTTCLRYELTFRNSKTQIHMMLIMEYMAVCQNSWPFPSDKKQMMYGSLADPFNSL